MISIDTAIKPFKCVTIFDLEGDVPRLGLRAEGEERRRDRRAPVGHRGGGPRGRTKRRSGRTLAESVGGRFGADPRRSHSAREGEGSGLRSREPQRWWW